MKNLKLELHRNCLIIVRKKVSAIELAINAQQDAANNETKSSAGDKYETGRAMAHFEQEKLASQLTTNRQLEKLLVSVDSGKQNTKVESGSLVKTNTGLFYITVAIGKVQINGQHIFVISPSAPLSQKMLGLKKGKSFEFNGKTVEIVNVV